MNKFYVYEHWRTDTNQCFYVGKGCGMRAFEKKKNRNEHYIRIANKLHSNGHEIRIVIIKDNLSENDAFLMEIERIAYWREAGVSLCNLTRGGDGICGIGEETLQKMRASSQKRWSNPENRKAASEKTKTLMSNPENRKKCASPTGRKLAPEVVAKISAALKGKSRPYMVDKMSGKNNHFYGKKHSPETLAKISAARSGVKLSEDAREKMKAAQQARRAREAENKNAPAR